MESCNSEVLSLSALNWNSHSLMSFTVYYTYTGVIFVTSSAGVDVWAKLSRIVGFLRLLHEIVHCVSCPELNAVIVLW